MFDVRELNIAIELWGVAFCAIGVACIILFGRAGGQDRRLVLAGEYPEAKRASSGGSLAFRGVQPEVMDVFEMTGFDKILTFE